jgi:choline dehydrogenase-like flavoprotein
MIVAPRDLSEGSVIEADLCIVGSGPVGITLARELKDTGLQIVILAGGVERETLANQDLHKGIVLPTGSHEPLEENRRRAFGGASIAWGGRCIPFDDIDFEKREWIPNSGWPFTYKDLEPRFVRAIEICKAGNFIFDARKAVKGETRSEIIKGLDNEDIDSTKMERWSPPVRFATDYYEDLSNATTIKVLLDTHLVAFNNGDKKEVVSSVTAKVEKRTITIKATTYVLACGGIENARLLLASKNKFHQNGIGNDNDNVGRYYQCHFFGTFASVSPSDRKNFVFNFERDEDGVYYRRRWWITRKAQIQKQIGNIIFFLHQDEHIEGHRDSLFSLAFVSRYILSAIRGRSIKKAKEDWALNKFAVKLHAAVVLNEGWRIVPNLINYVQGKFQRRQLPLLLPSINSKTFGLYCQAEHAPNPESRITISDTEFDALGVPRAVVKIAFTAIDKKTIVEAHKIFAERFTQCRLGKIDLNMEDLERFIDKSFANVNSAAHHLGTTRMSVDPKNGVVDENCKVHGMDNLFIMGGSIFPTGGHCNPTLTILALTIRLAEFFKSSIQH